MTELKLYHRLSDSDSAEVRRLIKSKDLYSRVTFANIEVGDRDRTELSIVSPVLQVPSLRVDGVTWLHGKELILKYLSEL